MKVGGGVVNDLMRYDACLEGTFFRATVDRFSWSHHDGWVMIRGGDGDVVGLHAL